MLMLAASVAACADGPTGVVPREEPAELVMAANVTGTTIATIVVSVTAPDLAGVLLFNLEIAEGVASGTLKVPPGQDRSIVVRAFDGDGLVTHEGQAIIDVTAGQNPPLAIVLVPRSGRVPITISVGELMILVPSWMSGVEGQAIQLEAAVVDGAFTPVAAELHWASANPALATVDQNGLVTLHKAGVVNIHVSFEGYSASSEFTITPPGHGAFAGFVFSRSGEPIENAFISTGSVFANTDSNGAFVLMLPEGEHTYFMTATGCIVPPSGSTTVFEGQRNFSVLTLVCELSNNETGTPAEADYCSVSPASIIIDESDPYQIFAEVFEAGVTEAAGAPVDVLAEIGFGFSGDDPRTSAAWTFQPMPYNQQSGDNDEWTFGPAWSMAGVNTSYVFRVSFDGGDSWTYCDADGAGSSSGFDFSTDQVGHLQIN